MTRGAAVPSAILLGAALIALAVGLTNRWQVAAGGHQGAIPLLYRIDRWTGVTEVCMPDPSTMRNENSLFGAKFICTPNE